MSLKKEIVPPGSKMDVLAHVLNLMPNPVYIKDKQHRWVEANQAFCDFLGYPREALLGKSDFDYASRENAQIYWDMDDEVFRTHEQNVNFEENVNSRGEVMWVESRKSYFQSEDGTEYLIGVITDLTELRKRELALEEAERKALAGAEAKSTFLANMSHEIRTPMNGVLGMTQILRGTELSPHQSELVNTLERSGDALLRLIDDILDFSKLEAGRLDLCAEPLCLRETVDDVAALLGVTARDKGLDLLVKFVPTQPDHMIGDAGRLRQILLNLAGNAIKFTETGFVLIDVTTKTVGDHVDVRIGVKDTGIGIPEDKLARIFEKFQQADGSTTRLYGGTGLGLAISRELAELMGGSLVAHSKSGEGSEFVFQARLPRSEQQKTIKDVPMDPATLSDLKILIVDDIVQNLDILELQLMRLGLRADRAVNAKAAIQKLAEAATAGSPYNLLITDYQMPDIDGLKMATLLKRHAAFAELPVIVMSSVNDAELRSQFLALGVQDYMVKPVSLPDFDRMIYGAVSSRHSEAA